MPERRVIFESLKGLTKSALEVTAELKWINLDTVSKLLGLNPQTIRRHESPDGKWCTIHGQTFRVYRVGIHPLPHRRYNEAEVLRALRAIEAERQRQVERKANRPWWA